MKITKKLYVHWKACEYMDAGGLYQVWDQDMSGLSEYGPPVAIQEVMFEVPEIDGRERLIDKLKQDKASIIAEATQKAQRLEERIQELLALPSAQPN